MGHLRLLIQKKTEFQKKLYDHKKEAKDKRLAQKAKEARDVEALIQQGAKKTPAQDEVKETSRADRYELEKMDLELELMDELAKNRTYHMRANEIELNKLGDLPSTE